MKKPKEIWLWDPVFRVNVYVVIGIRTGEQITDWFRREREIEYESYGEFRGRAITLDGGLNVYIFLAAMDVGDPEDHANLAHEAFHACHMILSLRGQVNQADDGEEAHAYVLGWMVRETLIQLSAKKSKR